MKKLPKKQLKTTRKFPLAIVTILVFVGGYMLGSEMNNIEENNDPADVTVEEVNDTEENKSNEIKKAIEQEQPQLTRQEEVKEIRTIPIPEGWIERQIGDLLFSFPEETQVFESECQVEVCLLSGIRFGNPPSLTWAHAGIYEYGSITMEEYINNLEKNVAGHVLDGSIQEIEVNGIQGVKYQLAFGGNSQNYTFSYQDYVYSFQSINGSTHDAIIDTLRTAD